MSDTTICQCCRHVVDKLAIHGCYAGGELSADLCGRCAEFFWRVVHHFKSPTAAIDPNYEAAIADLGKV